MPSFTEHIFEASAAKQSIFQKTGRQATRGWVQNVTVNVGHSFDGLLLDLVICHGWNPEHHLLLRTDQATQSYEQSKELKNQIRRENSAYLSHLKALDKGVEEKRGKADAILENALRWVCSYKEKKPKLMLLVDSFI
jgi:hypothetical protein